MVDSKWLFQYQKLMSLYLIWTFHSVQAHISLSDNDCYSEVLHHDQWYCSLYVQQQTINHEDGFESVHVGYSDIDTKESLSKLWKRENIHSKSTCEGLYISNHVSFHCEVLGPFIRLPLCWLAFSMHSYSTFSHIQ